MNDQQRVREDAFGNPITACKCPTCGAPAEREEVDGAYDSRTTYKYALAHASSERGEECSVDDYVAGGGKLVGGPVAFRYRFQNDDGTWAGWIYKEKSPSILPGDRAQVEQLFISTEASHVLR